MVQTAKTLKGSMATITKLDGEFSVARAALAAAQAQALADIIAARAEVLVVRAEVEEAAAVAQDKAEKTVEDEFATGFF